MVSPAILHKRLFSLSQDNGPIKIAAFTPSIFLFGPRFPGQNRLLRSRSWHAVSQEGGMGVVEKDIGRVRGKVTEVAHGKLFQGRSQGRSIKMVGGKTVRLILILAGETVHGQSHERGERRVEKSKTDQGQMEAMDIGAQGRREHRVGNKQATGYRA